MKPFRLQRLLMLLMLLFSWWTGVQSQLACNARTAARQKRIVIRNPGTDGELAKLDSCQYEVAPWSTQVCQVRIDFERLELPQPRLNASTQRLECVDFLQLQRFQLCGRNSGQHLYVRLQRGQTLKFHFQLGSHSAQSTWQLTLTQLECPQPTHHQPAATPLQPNVPGVRPLLPFLGNLLPRTIFGGNPGGGPAAQLLQTLTAPTPADLELLAPLGCDQYWRSPSGGIVSFNFAGGVYMANMRYTICVAGRAGQEISYKMEHFALSKFNDSPGPGYDSDCHSTVRTVGRASDYLLIPNSHMANNQALQPTYYCGNGLAGSRLIGRPPFVIYFSSDAETSAVETGFQLTYAVQESKLEL